MEHYQLTPYCGLRVPEVHYYTSVIYINHFAVRGTNRMGWGVQDGLVIHSFAYFPCHSWEAKKSSEDD